MSPRVAEIASGAGWAIHLSHGKDPAIEAYAADLGERLAISQPDHGGRILDIELRLGGGTSVASPTGDGRASFQLDIAQFEPAQVEALLHPVLHGPRDLGELVEHVQRRLSLLALDGHPDPNAAVVRLIEKQLQADAADPQTLARWSRSTVIDENTKEATLGPGTVSWLETHGSLGPSTWPVSHAGVLHTYGYLLSTAWTPFGWKADRYLDATLADFLAVAHDDFTPWAANGTMLGNLTAALDDVVASREADVVIDESGVLKFPDGEQRPGTLRTRLFRPVAADAAWLLVYSIEVDTDERFVTAFPMGEAGVQALRTDDAEARTRYNVAAELLDGSRSVIART